MKNILILLAFIPFLSFAQDSILIYKTFGEDTLWQVKRITNTDNISTKSFTDSSDIYYYLLNDIIDESRKMADAFNLIERHDEYLSSLQKLNRQMINGNIKGAFDYLSDYHANKWAGDFHAVLNNKKLAKGVKIFLNEKNKLKIQFEDNKSNEFITISDTYGIIVNYPKLGDLFVIYKTKPNVFKDAKNELTLKRKQ